MIKQLKLPSALWSDNEVYTDYSVRAANYGRDTCSLAALSATQDYFYFGLYKQFSKVYIEVSTANAAAIALDWEYYNGTAWTDIVNDVDDTLGFSRSGFIQWDVNQTAWATTTVNSIASKYWVRFRPASNFDAGAAIYGVNIVYSDDQDLIMEAPEVASYYPASTSSFILRHQAARDDIVQDIRNSGKYKVSYADGLFRNVDVWDLLDIDEIRVWSKYLVLSKIFENLSTVKDDVYWARSEGYKAKAGTASKLYYLTLDGDDDGVTDIEERLATTFGSISIIKTG